MADKEYIYTLGRRKTSIATLRLYGKEGKSTVNGKLLNELYIHESDRLKLLKPFKVANLDESNFMFTVKVKGGGFSSQLEAIRLALSRAIIKKHPDIKKSLKIEGLLTRDPRMVERKKTGLRKARKAEQYSKR